jgi:outer membrane biosynthesis protein TonB
MEQNPNSLKNQAPKRPAPRRDRLNLPFDDKRQDPMSWIYENRLGLFVTIIILLVSATIFVTAKIVTKVPKTSDTIYIEMDMTEPEKEQPKEPEPPKERPKARDEVDWKSVRNVVSNDAAAESEKETPTRHTNDDELQAAAKAAEQNMKANQEAYERGLTEVGNIGKEEPVQPTPTEKKGDKGGSPDVKQKGNVTVRYSFTDPTRRALHLVIPAYRCEGGGEVVVAAVINQNGKVVSARVDSGGDACMRSIAVSAARSSTFNVDTSAPEKQEGTITYIFIPQQ